MQLVTFGEAMLRLTPRGSGFDVYVGGAELNVAVAAAKLGVASRWVSRLPENPAGRMIARRAQEEGVDVSRVAWTSEGRAGVFYVEVGDDPSATTVTYDRAGSAMALIAPGMIDWASTLRGARWLHVSGITPALSDSAAATMNECLTAARAERLTISYDLNYRPKLWNPERARVVQEPLLRYADLFIAGEDAARLVFGLEQNTADEVARELQRRYDLPAVAITVRDSKRRRSATWSALVVADGATHCAEPQSCEVIDPLGAGDAFAGGLIAARLHNESWERAMRDGVSLAARKHGTRGDFSTATSADPCT
jgi:2-dehydro-3-deoxygluconokinase